MKKSMNCLLLVVMIIPTCLAYGQNNNNSNRCDASIVKGMRKERESGAAVPLDECEKLNIVAIANKNSKLGRPNRIQTVDNKYFCVFHGGYTVDFDDCKKVKNAYDQVVLAEIGMLKMQEVRVNENNIQQLKEYEKANAKGDGQNAAIDATIKRNEMNAQMYNNQAKIYSGAVAYLGTTMSTWKGRKNKEFEKGCKDESKIATFTARVTEDHGPVIPTLYPTGEALCNAVTAEMKDDPDVYANNDMRGRFLQALAEYTQKAAAAKLNAAKNEDVAKRHRDAPNFANDETITQFDKCVLDPNSIDCKKQGPGNRSGPGAIKGSTFSMGGGNAAHHAFNLDPGAAANIGDDELGEGTDSPNVADIASPFEAEAKEASGILDPAGAASANPGGGGGGGGGGGPGGGGGGGSVALSDDLAGATADDNKDPEIKTNKVAGKYSTSSGSFQGVKSRKDDGANPFASMFDSKENKGGIEEDRSIASDDNGEASGLFQKISRRYGQVQADKRIESQNLE